MHNHIFTHTEQKIKRINGKATQTNQQTTVVRFVWKEEELSWRRKGKNNTGITFLGFLYRAVLPSPTLSWLRASKTSVSQLDMLQFSERT